MGKLFSIYYWVTMVLLWLKSQVGCEGKWLCPIEGIILSHHRPQEAWDVLAHMAEIKTESILGRRWNVKCCVTALNELKWLAMDVIWRMQKKLSCYFLHPFIYIFIYSFIHSFFCSVLLINSVLVIIDLCTYFSVTASVFLLGILLVF